VIIQSLGPNSGIEIDHNDSIEDGSLVALFNAPGTSIDHNTIVRSSGSAIFIGSGNDGTSISHNRIRGAQFRGIHIDAPEFGGPANANMIIAHNDIRNMGDTGVGVAPNSLVHSLIDHNQVQNNGGGGIWIEDSSTPGSCRRWFSGRPGTTRSGPPGPSGSRGYAPAEAPRAGPGRQEVRRGGGGRRERPRVNRLSRCARRSDDTDARNEALRCFGRSDRRAQMKSRFSRPAHDDVRSPWR
jgi:hypothetical protein